MSLQHTEQLEVLSRLFNDIGKVVVPSDFLKLTRDAVYNLKKQGRSNLVYQLARCLGTNRDDGTDTLLPVKRMPTGLIEYIVGFFNAENLQQVQNNTKWNMYMYVLYICSMLQLVIHLHVGAVPK